MTVDSPSAANAGLRDAWGQPYVPAVSPRLKIVLAFIFLAVAALGATGVYLSSIRWLDSLTGKTYTTPFKYWMLLAHIAVGFVALIPFLAFGVLHWISARKRPNRLAVRLGTTLFLVGVLVCVTGIGLIRIEGMPQLRTETTAHSAVMWLHLLLPLVAVVLYIMHRRAGPDIKWRWGYSWGGVVGIFVFGMLIFHGMDPNAWFKQGSIEGRFYFRPSEVLTSDGNFIAPEALMMDTYCMKCHQDIYNDHLHSAHKFSSFSNPAYLFSVRETRKVGLERDEHVKASRWCAGCHDPVPFFGGVFEDPTQDPKFDPKRDALRLDRYREVEDVIAGRKHPADSPISSAGITCVACHGITHINSPIGNAAYTIEEPQHYPFAFSKNRTLQWVNNQLIKSEPSFHKKTFLKPFHKTAEFCATCHKVALPIELNYYKEFLRGQNHYDSYLLSGVSGVGVRSFYYPPQAKKNCAECHMPTRESGDFGSREFDQDGKLKGHDHRFAGGNTGLFDLLKRDPKYESLVPGFEKTIQAQTDFLRGTDPDGKDKKIRIDLFGVKEGVGIDGKLTVLRPELPALKPGKSYVVEVVVRTLNIGHPFSQGTVDSNEIWIDFEAKSGGRTIARNGATAKADDSGEVDRWAHFINVLMLDRKGQRINRRNPQDIFTPLYDKQIPPGAAAAAHYQLDVPPDAAGTIELEARVRYRKFDQEYMDLVHKPNPTPKLPIVDICRDSVTLPVEGMADAKAVPKQQSPIKPAWQRWNDYGIGCYLEGGAAPTGLSQKRGEMKQALAAFQHLIATGEKDALAHGYLNAARVLIDDTGRLNEAAQMLNKAEDNGAPWWTVAWFKAIVATQNVTRKGQLEAAISLLEKILSPTNQPANRGFDFRRDYIVLARLGNVLFKLSQLEQEDPSIEEAHLRRAIDAYERALAVDPEDVDSHYGLYQCYDRLARNLPPRAGAKPVAVPEAEDLQRLGTDLANPSGRREATWTLMRDVPAFLDRPKVQGNRPVKFILKLPTIRVLIPQLSQAFHAEPDEQTRQALAHVLALLHNESNLIYKLDDNARSNATTTYRRRNPAANHAAEAIVIYPTTKAQVEAILRKSAGGVGGQ